MRTAESFASTSNGIDVQNSPGAGSEIGDGPMEFSNRPVLVELQNSPGEQLAKFGMALQILSLFLRAGPFPIALSLIGLALTILGLLRKQDALFRIIQRQEREICQLSETVLKQNNVLSAGTTDGD
jgi:hypothetical protein